MKKHLKLCLAILLMTFFVNVFAVPKTFSLQSPDARLAAIIEHEKSMGIKLSITLDSEPLMKPSTIGLTLMNGEGITRGTTIAHVKRDDKTEHIEAPFYRQKSFNIAYKQLELKFKNGYGIKVRAYNEGIAYQFIKYSKHEAIILQETAQFQFNAGNQAWLSYSTNEKNPLAMAFQNTYHHTALKDAQSLPAFLPATIDCGKAKVTLTEADLKSYPGMFVQAKGGMLEGVFAPYPKEMDTYAWRGMTYVKETHPYIACSKGARSYPWRIFCVSEKDTQMPVNNLVYALAEPSRITDTSWIKPGKVAWEWWNDWNLTGVDFKAGINTATYKYYIDFAARNGLEYVVLDEGWYDSNKGDIMHPIADIDLQELINYGRKKNVDIVLWTVFNVLDEHLEEACKKYAAMGVKGFKVDFLDRDDQTAIEMTYRIAETAARHHLILDYHGYFKPTGLNRTFPNVLNFEGVFGMEEAKWTKMGTDMPLYDVTFPYIRMQAGNVDFTPGAMRNGTKKDWTAIYTKPISMGTRCHQLACYIIHDSPFTMLCDSPTDYEKEPRCTRFIASLPVTFDSTAIVQGEMGKYIVTLRKKGNDWYLAGQTNWDERDLTLSFDFLEKGINYKAESFTDGVNANHNAEDFATHTHTVNRQSKLNIHLAQGGGFAIKITK